MKKEIIILLLVATLIGTIGIISADSDDCPNCLDDYPKNSFTYIVVEESSNCNYIPPAVATPA